MRKIEIYTDGGCNALTDKKGTWAFVAVTEDSILKEEWGNIEKTTNSVVELTAVQKAYHYALTFDKNIPITIYCDSSYVVSGCNEWGDKWLENNYRNGKIKYTKIWNSFLPRRRSNITVKWIKGHNGNFWNEYVDKLTHNGRELDITFGSMSVSKVIYDYLQRNIQNLTNKELDDFYEMINMECLRRTTGHILKS